MIITCNVTGSERKRLAEALGAILLWEPVYSKAPTFAYVVNDYTIDKTGTIICPDSATAEDVEEIANKLESEGFSPVIDGEALIEPNTAESTEVPDASETTTDVEASAEDEAMDSDKEVPADIPAETPDVALENEDAAQPDGEAESPAEGAETPNKGKESVKEDAPEEVIAVPDDDTLLTISIPRSKVPDDVLIRLQAIVLNKKVLFQRALQTDTLPIEATDETVSFPWFKLTGIDGESEAYAQFITHLVKMANEQTRVLDKPYDGDNDKFAMRIFMVRMGMKGDKFALARKLMMKHLTGNSGWRYGAPPKKEAVPAPTVSSDEMASTEADSTQTEELLPESPTEVTSSAETEATDEEVQSTSV